MSESLQSLEQLGEFLERNHYRTLIHHLTNGRIHQTPWAKCPRQRITRLPRPLAGLLRLFHLGEVVDGVEEWLGRDLLDRLVDAGLLRQVPGGVSLGEYVILPFEGILLIAQRWEPGNATAEDHLWLGADTSFVSKVVSPGRAARVLEVCTGIGTHALVMASRGAEVWGVDLNPQAIRVATWNKWLNGLQHRVHFHHGDLYAPVGDRQFDYVVSSPPFLPYPEQGTTTLLFATAGPDGLVVMRRILDELGPRLSPRGRALFLAAGFGDDKAPEILRDLESRAGREQWKIELILLGDGDARSEMGRLGRELPTVASDLETLAADHGADERYYSFLIAIENGAGASSGCALVDGRSSWTEGLRQLRAAERVATTAGGS